MTWTAAHARSATEVVTLAAEVLEVVTEGDRHWASVRFTGTLREGGGATPAPFDEVWNLSKPVDGKTGWLLAGIQQPDDAPLTRRCPQGVSALGRGARPMRFDPAALPAALANRVLGRESWARTCLAAHAGRVFAVAVGPL